MLAGMLAARLNPHAAAVHTTIPGLGVLRALVVRHQTAVYSTRRGRDPQIGLTTPVPDDVPKQKAASPFYFEAGYAGWAKRPSRPFPPPFFSPPSGSFSDPLSTHHRSQDRRTSVNGQMIRGVTVGDDALLASESLIGANDGVGAWAQKERGNAPLWSRLILHFLALAAEEDNYGGRTGTPDPVRYLSEAYANTKEALSPPTEWFGTTTACSALLHHTEKEEGEARRPLVYVTQVGDSRIMILRPREKKVLFETEEQWHYFDCPRQLGTNSPDTPQENAVLSKVEVEIDDMVLAMSDGVTDNLWVEDMIETVTTSLDGWREQVDTGKLGSDVGEGGNLAEGMRHVAQELVLAARRVAEDPFATSPFMERAVEEGLAVEGGKLDDISVAVALCRRR
ncbi:hypothetical protein B0A50_04176 [Salinomyces thailandicus]|uniref:Protein phosphatase n=1 Tax=Salinomyces thailandicus TaxID=706561 RepID=A0A4U0U0J7_9PEZI|nr:hypothetical protein B0A50_04176 [Salinomyces thailandica]